MTEDAATKYEKEKACEKKILEDFFIEGCKNLVICRSRRIQPVSGAGDHRRSGPVSEKQRAWREKFKQFAASCRGKGDYRACMKEKLKK